MREAEWLEAIKRKYPEHVVFVVACDSSGKPNVMPAGWCTIASANPPMLAVCISHRNYTHKLIEETGEFVIVFPNEEMADLIKYTGSCSGRHVDKFAECAIETVNSKYVKPPLIKDAVACFECKVRGKMTAGDHTIFVGEVLASYVSEKYRYRLYNFGDGIFRTVPYEK